MPHHPQRFWLAAIIIAWSVDFLFWGKNAGVSFLVFVALSITAGYLLSYSETLRPARSSFALSGLIVLLGLITTLRSEPFTRFYSGCLAFLSLGLLALTLRRGGWARFRLVDFLLGAVNLLVVSLSGGYSLRISPTSGAGGKGLSFWRRAVPVLRGLLIALPVVIVLAALLSSADLVFAGEIKAFLANFNLDRLPEYLFRLIYILMLAYLFAGFYLNAVFPRPLSIGEASALTGSAAAGRAPEEGGLPDQAGAPEQVNRRPALRFLGQVESFIVLGSVDLLFAFFVAIQFRYFFGGQSNITAAGYTYSEYARRGFSELVIVAVLSLLLYLVLNAVTWLQTKAQARAFTGLSVLLVGLVCVILTSAFQRLLLYETAYGFTRLRTYTHIFIPWLGFLLLATIALQILHRERSFASLLLLTSFGFAITLGIINIDGFIARQNVTRGVQGEALDGNYLLSLSDDALPALAGEFSRPGQLPAVRDMLGMVLACRVYSQAQEAPPPWQSYHLGSALNRQALAGLDLSGYNLHPGDGSPYVVKDGVAFSCAPNPSLR